MPYKDIAVQISEYARRRWICGAVLAACSVAAVSCFLNYQGYCLVKLRKLSEAEKIDMAIEHVISGSQPDLIVPDGVGGTMLLKAVRYADIADFKKVNKDCCQEKHSRSEGGSPSVLCRLVGGTSSFIRIDYQRRNRATDDKTVIANVRRYVHMTNCGVAD